MPIAFDPNVVGKWSLKTDRAKPEPRPLFTVRFLTDRQCDEIDRKRDMSDLRDSDGGVPAEKFWARWWEVLTMGVTGWRNMPWAAAGLPDKAPFTLDNVCATLIHDEMGELYSGFTAGVTLDEGDIKNLPGQPSPTGQEAKTAAVETPQAAA